MELKKRAPAIVIALLALGLIIFWIAYTRLIPSEKAPDFMESTGVIEATEVDLAPKVPGRVEWLCCKEGDSVKAGALAVRLESGELKARVEEGRAALSGAVQALNESRVGLENAVTQSEAARYEADASGAEVERVKALTEDAKENLERAEGLFKDGFISKKDLDSARTAYEANAALLSSARSRRLSADANVRTSSVNIKAAKARIASAEARRAQAEAQLNVVLAELKDTEIYSPIDGVIAYKSFELGEFVNPGSSIYTVDDLGNIWARLDVEETDIQKIRVGSRAETTSTASDKVFEGRVIEIGEVGGFATQRDVTRGRSDIKTFRVKAGIERPEGLLKPGMTVRVRVFFKS